MKTKDLAYIALFAAITAVLGLVPAIAVGPVPITAQTLGVMLAGSITFGYIIYGLAHFIIHHVRFKQPWLRRWAGAHHVHHYHPDTNFGVTTPLWDVLLRTRYVRQPRKA